MCPGFILNLKGHYFMAIVPCTGASLMYLSLYNIIIHHCILKSVHSKSGYFLPIGCFRYIANPGGSRFKITVSVSFEQNMTNFSVHECLKKELCFHKTQSKVNELWLFKAGISEPKIT